MVRRRVRLARAAVFGTFAVAMLGCANVSPDDLNAQMAQLREEYQAADQQLSGRIDQLENRVSSLESDLQSLRNDFNATMEQMQGMLRFNVPVHFGFDEATIRELDKPVLNRFSEVVKRHFANGLVTVEGFADPAGSEAYNIRLGKRRSDAVKQYLTTTGGIAPDMVKSVSYGESADRQVIPGARGPGMTGIENRRVTLVIDYGGEVRGR